MFKRTSLITSLTCALLLTTFTSSLGQQESPPGQGSMPKHNMRKELKDKLNLSPEQEKQLKDVRFKYAKDQIQVRANLQSKRLDVQQIMQSDKLDRAVLEKKWREIGDLQVQQKLMAFDQQQEMKKNLTPEQQKIIKDFRENFPRPDRRAMRERIRERFDRRVE